MHSVRVQALIFMKCPIKYSRVFISEIQLRGRATGAPKAKVEYLVIIAFFRENLILPLYDVFYDVNLCYEELYLYKYA